jgi:hypothetical protein
VTERKRAMPRDKSTDFFIQELHSGRWHKDRFVSAGDIFGPISICGDTAVEQQQTRVSEENNSRPDLKQ